MSFDIEDVAFRLVQAQRTANLIAEQQKKDASATASQQSSLLSSVRPFPNPHQFATVNSGAVKQRIYSFDIPPGESAIIREMWNNYYTSTLGFFVVDGISIEAQPIERDVDTTRLLIDVSDTIEYFVTNQSNFNLDMEVYINGVLFPKTLREQIITLIRAGAV